MLGQLGRYTLLEQVGVGSTGTVYKALDTWAREIVAVKVLAEEFVSNPLMMARFELEFRITTRVQHPNVVRMRDFCNSGPPYLVMDYVDGGSLADRLERSGPIPEDEAIRLIVQVAHALHEAHGKGLVHRDIKPDNILISADGQAKLTDLGLAKDLDGNAELTKTGRGLGTPNFMAPEQFRSAKSAGVPADVYSLGATLYHLLTGTLPFHGAGPMEVWMKKMNNDLPSPESVVPGLSERTSAVILEALQNDPARRPASCREFVDRLLGWGQPVPTPAEPIHLPTEPVIEVVTRAAAATMRPSAVLALANTLTEKPDESPGPARRDVSWWLVGVTFAVALVLGVLVYLRYAGGSH